MKKIFSNIWFLSGITLILFLITNRYIYGWDDQALEIPLLKHLIDPELYPNDYYVQSLKENFSSYLYPILAKIISVSQVPAVYFLLYLVSRYFLFFFSLKLWTHLSKSTWIAFCATVMSFLIGRTEEFLYRTFSHQEFALAIIMAGFYYLYKERFFLCAILFGIAANFNALYALFPMIYCCCFLLFSKQFKQLIISSLLFMLGALPFLVWMFSNKISAPALDPAIYDNWQRLFMIACPQNFLFQTQPLSEAFNNVSNALTALGPYLFLITLYIFNCLFNSQFRRSKISHAIMFSAVGLLSISFVFSYWVPNRFIIDLNLIRNMQYLNFVLMGFTTLWIVRTIKEGNQNQAFYAAVLFSLLSFRHLSGVFILIFVSIGLWLRNKSNESSDKESLKHFFIRGIDLVILAGLFFILNHYFDIAGLKYKLLSLSTILISVLFLLLFFIKERPYTLWIRQLMLIIPLLTMFGYFSVLHYNYVKITTTGGGFWQLQRNWEEMQLFVKENTPKDALLMVPYNMEMGGFRIGSERSIIVSYRDCGIVGFDYPALKEWEKRIKDIEDFMVIPQKSFQNALIKGLGKYKADYIVFTRFIAPEKSNATLKKIHENEIFVLFKVNRIK